MVWRSSIYTHPPKFYWQLFAKVVKNRARNKVSLVDKFHGLAGVYHQYVLSMSLNKLKVTHRK